MSQNEFSGSTFSSNDYEAFIITNNFDDKKEPFGYAFVLKDGNREDQLENEILKDESLMEELKNAPLVLEFFQSNKTVLPEDISNEISSEQQRDLESNIEGIEDPELRSEVKSLYERIKERAKPIFAKLFMALGLFIAAQAKPRNVLDAKNLEFTNSMPLNFDIESFYGQSIAETGATQSMSFYYTGSTESNI